MGLQALMIAAVAVLPSADAGGDVAKEVEGAVRAVQAAFNKGDARTLKRLMTEDHLTILTYARFSTAAGQLKVLSAWKLSEYKMSGLEVRALTKDVALASYRATIKGTYKGKDVPSPVRVVQVWVKRDGRWLEASYQETPQGGK
jgi:uncharacterized protein (TIGR02246 family)